MADEHVDALLFSLCPARFAALRRQGASLHGRDPEAVAGGESSIRPVMSRVPRVDDVDEHPAA
ncbi:MAG: hypothetical protein F4Z77_12105 [Dehalococcoidia bacterium]|nr:hypothetical protein [Dehalococcoidia bacterium]MYA54202.1 hypothetical protein [Dehalococcoidia bacterium]